jgi:NAD(P)-dependent dehydrogenase (short-subunit alcohol dehydrogenase family)
MSRWTVADIPSQAGKFAIVTGPTGLGYETGLALARAGADVVLAGRNPKTGIDAAQRAAAASGGKVRFERLDLASLASVRAFAGRIVAAGRPVDLLVNNAGVMMPPKRQLTADGFELQLGTNYLGHFALTGLLLPLLRAARGRVVSISSISAVGASIHFDDLDFARAYRPDPSYGQSKLAMLLFAFELQRRSAGNGWGITSLAAHPGIARTDLIDKGPGATSALGVISRLLPFVRQPVDRGALPILHAATAPEAVAGAYYGPNGFQEIRGYPRRVRGPIAAQDETAARRLWEVSVERTGVDFGAARQPA